MAQERHIRKYRKMLASCEPSFKAIFEGGFSNEGRTLVEYDEGEKTVCLSYSEIAAMIDDAAYSLKKLLGGKKDSFIALNFDNSPEWIVLFWAILKSGNKPYLVNRRHPLCLTKGIIKTLGIEVSIDQEKNEYGAKSVSYSELKEKCPKGEAFAWADSFAISTSGTSLEEKVCVYTGKEMLSQMQNTEWALKRSKQLKKHYHNDVKLLAFLPFYHIFGLIASYFWYTYFGYPVVILRDYSPETIVRTIKKHEVTHLFAVPLFWHTLEDRIRKTVAEMGEDVAKKLQKGIRTSLALQNKSPRLGKAFARKAFKDVRRASLGESVQFCISGGSYIKQSSLELFNAMGYSLHGGYGSSELGIVSVELSERPKDILSDSVGRPFPTVEAKIEDGTLRVKGSSACHEIIVNGEDFKGNDWFDTLDNAHFGKKGRLYIDGRKSDIVIGSSGENVNPDEVEKALVLDSAAMKRYSVSGIKDGGDEKLSLVVEVREDIVDEEIEAIKKQAYAQNATLPMASRIERFYFTYEEIMNPNAIKVSRGLLLKKIEEGKVKLIAFDGMKSKKSEVIDDEIYHAVVSIIASVLSLDESKIAPESHFMFDLGGTSLDYFDLISSLRERFSFSMEEMGQEPLYTAKEIAEAIRGSLR